MAAAGSSQEGRPCQPAAIVRLEDSVVHRIAAGEVVQRPSSALKEMLENSLDAGAKHITVVVKEGGLKYLQIQDDGCGIRLDDLPILCHRHTTSKLRAYEDLDTIATLGFRGEALASISFVSHVTVTTMTAGLQHGYRVKYSDGEMLPPGPKPVAAVPGTSIIVEDMFYNMLPRRRSFKPGPEEHNLLLDVLQKYAIFKAGSVGFTLKRQGEARSDLHTLPAAGRLDVIRGLFGPDLAASLLPLQLTGGAGNLDESVPLDGPMSFSAQGFASNLTHAGRKSVLILFINGRPVDHSQLKRALEATYTAHNPKASKPWVFLELRLPPRHVEVNVHPTKKEVGFLHQQDIIDSICRALEQLLLQSMNTRTFAVNQPAALAAAAPASDPAAAAADGPQNAADAAADEAAEPAAASGGQRPQQPGTQQRPFSARSVGSQQPGTQSSYRPQKLVRTDHRAQTLDGFFVSQASAAAVATAAAPVPARRRSSAARAGRGAGSDGSGAGGGLFSQDAAGLEGGSEPFSNASLHLQAAAAEQEAAAAELQAAAAAATAGQASSDQQQQQGTQAAPVQGQLLLRAACQPKLPVVVTQLSSVRDLLDEVVAAVHGELEQLFRQHTWVGMADDRLVLLQHGTRLYLADSAAISRDLFYQLLLSRWQACRVMTLARPLPVRQLMDAALQLEEAAGRWKPEPGGSRQELFVMVEALLAQKAQMLQEYVGLVFTAAAPGPAAPAETTQRLQQQQEGSGLCLAGLPLLLDGYVPDLSCLPRLVLQLARDVDWDTEQACFRSLAEVMAGFYALQPLLLAPRQAGPDAAQHRQQGAESSGECAGQPAASTAAAAGAAAHSAPAGGDAAYPMDIDDERAAAAAAPAKLLGAHRCQQQREWLLRHVVMPAVKHMYRPPRERARDGSVLLLTSMEKLYRVFERCGW